MRIHITSKSLKPAAGALGLALLVGVGSMGGCGGRHVINPAAAAPSTTSVTSSAQFEAGNTVK